MYVPAVENGDDSCLKDTNLFVSGNGHVEMLERHVAPSAVVIRQGEIGRTEVGCCHSHGSAGYTPPRFIALQLEACPAAEAVVKERSAQSCCVRSIALAVQIPIPASTACKFTATNISTTFQNAKFSIRNEQFFKTPGNYHGITTYGNPARTLPTLSSWSVTSSIEGGMRVAPRCVASVSTLSVCVMSPWSQGQNEDYSEWYEGGRHLHAAQHTTTTTMSDSGDPSHKTKNLRAILNKQDEILVSSRTSWSA